MGIANLTAKSQFSPPALKLTSAPAGHRKAIKRDSETGYDLLFIGCDENRVKRPADFKPSIGWPAAVQPALHNDNFVDRQKAGLGRVVTPVWVFTM
ncbi:uncharacterized protein SPSK_03725 [Sporothrix schenckii 1099-18]|uniref:Uncharacterized protein n=1 Tax=Sporothrix schenckii 1099-18 TaxID=1397361 RepID=A0A0F2LZY9_SPOSC|nr:uncharacterized protein SPSK_03725 [Sporothrix schenckii 1099-18]KJR82414.1 hypothetical protein SPSK_03725 [Sporothrix schenckii 1099-18]